MEMEKPARMRQRDPSLGWTRRCGAVRCGTAYEAAWPGRRNSDDSGRRRRRPDQPNEPGRCLGDRVAMPVLHGQANVRHNCGHRQRTALAGGHAEQVEAALQCAIRPEGRHDRAAALYASDGERACAAMVTLWDGKVGSVENKILN
eukprot:scaffold26604_cov116-Isochrysis_galbana.AAC.8